MQEWSIKWGFMKAMFNRKILIPGSITHGKSMRYNRFTKEEAISICSRKVHSRKIEPLSCFGCYYHDGKCEIHVGFEGNNGICEDYLNDVHTTNHVRKHILNDYKWCIRYLDEFCQVDRELFVAIYGKRVDGGIAIREENL